VSACSRNQRWTSAGDSDLGLIMYGCHNTYMHVKKKSKQKTSRQKPQRKARPAPDLTRDLAFRTRN
jgi:hypothetical protein